ncbi:MAG: hypothetical protein AAFZ15_33880 [Bacteroidota bacterium]
MKTMILFLSFVLSTTLSFSNQQTFTPVTCSAPSNLALVSTDATFTFDWDDCGCSPTEYRVFYKRGGATSHEFSTSSSDITFTGLAPGNYEFYFYTVCQTGISSIIITSDVVEN